MKKMTALLLTLVLLTGMLATCSAEKSAGAAAKDSVTIAYSGGHSTFNSFEAQVMLDVNVLYCVQERLYRYDVYYGELIPCLATGYESNEDSTVFRFTIRDDAMFSDGNRLTAADIAFTIEQAAANPYAMGYIPTFDHCNVLSDTELEVCFAAPTPAGVYAVSGYWMGTLEKSEYEKDPEAYLACPIGSGAYMITEYDADHVVLGLNPCYRGEAPAISAVTLQGITDAEAMSMALENGEVNYAIINGTTKQVLSGNESVTVAPAASARSAYAAFNCSDSSPFSDENVRRAVACILDREAIGVIAYSQDVRVNSYQPVFSGSFGYVEAENDYAYSAEKAREYMAQSAYPDGFACSLITMELPALNKLSQIVAASLEELGIICDIHVEDPMTWQTDAFTGNYDINLFNMSIGSNMQDWGTYLTSPMVGICNLAMYANADLDALFDEAAGVADAARRNELYAQIQQILSDDLPILKICEVGLDIAFSNGLNADTWTDGVLCIDAMYWE